MLRFFAVMFLALTVPVSAAYTAEGYKTRDAMMARYFSLSTAEQGTAHLMPMVRDSACRWSDPFLMVWDMGTNVPEEGRRRTVGGAPRYEVTELPPFFAWLAGTSRDEAVTIDTRREDVPYVMVRWVAPQCGGMP